MKHLVKFKLFELANPRDISFVSSLNDYFTVSFEFEIETEDRSNIKIDFSVLYDDDIVNDITSIVKQELKLRTRSSKNLVDDLIYSVIDNSENGVISSEGLYKLFDTSNCKTVEEIEIFEFTKTILMSHISGEDIEYMTQKAKEHLPNFTTKWDDKITYVDDATLERGIEIKPKTYLTELTEANEMVNDFYSDMENQSYWSFTSRTGIHINIGVNSENIEWNPIKGLLILNDYNEEGKTPLTFKGMDWRMNSHFCGSLIPSINNMEPEKKEELKNSIDINNLKETEDKLNEFITKRIHEVGHKNFGFNITKLQHNYVEFRYVGGEISKETLLEKMNYFCFVVYAMTNPEFKRREYLKKIYKFVTNL